MASTTPPLVNGPITINGPEDAFRQLWSEALRKCEQSSIDNSAQWKSLLYRMEQCSDAEEVCVVLDETIRSFERFRGSDTAWGKLRNKYLKPAIELLLLFSDAISETAASFPNVPGGKAVFVAFASLLQATKGVTAYCEALIVLFEELNNFLDSLRPRLHTQSSLGPASRTIAIAILAQLINVIARTTKLLSKNPWLGRFGLYGKALLKDTAMQGELQRLRSLTDLEVRAIVSETRVDTSDIRGVTAEILSKSRIADAKNTEFTSQVLCELQVLNQLHVQATTGRGIIGRGVERLVQGQKDIMAILRSEREERERNDAFQIYEILNPVARADIDAQSPDGCMAGTRVTILKELRSWAHGCDVPRIYWLNGMAGTGKSALARSFCHQLRRDNLLGGSFFCSRGGSVEEGDAQRIIPTLAASLASRNSSYNKSLFATLDDFKPFSSHWNSHSQIERLLRQPLSSISEGFPMLVLVIDALDECANDDATGEFLKQLVEISRVLPVKFFLTSRPEPHIRQWLEGSDPSIRHVLRLHDIEQDIVASDISLYITNGLHGMRGPTFPLKWPRKADISTLTRLSGKLFIYAFTALQYLRKDPLGRLPKLTGTVVTAGRPLTQPLDDIYTLILSEAMDPDEFEPEELDISRRVMAFIVTVRQPMTIESLGLLIGMSAARLRASLDRLHAVIYVPVYDDSGVLSTFHASFGDFLNSSNRRPDNMHPLMDQSHALLTLACFDIFDSKLHFNVSRAASSYLTNKQQKLAHIDCALRYACLHWVHHIIAAAGSPDFDPSNQLYYMFGGPRILFWLEALSAMGLFGQAEDILREARCYLPTARYWNEVITYWYEFAGRFYSACAKSTPHIYLSALALCEKDSVIGSRCLSYFPDMLTLDANDTCGYDLLPLFAVYSPDGSCIRVGTQAGIETFSGKRMKFTDRRIYNFEHDTIDARYMAVSKDGSHVARLGHHFLKYYRLSGHGNILSSAIYMPSSSKGIYPRDIQRIAFCANGNKLAISSKNGICIWNTVSDKPSRTIECGELGPTSSIYAFALSPDASFVACGHSQGLVALWRIDHSGREITISSRFPVHASGTVECIDFHPDGTQAASVSSDGTLCMWAVPFVAGTSIAYFKNLCQNRHAPDSVSCLAFTPDGSRIVTGSLDGGMVIWDVALEQSLHRIEVLQPVRSITISPDSALILCITVYGAVQLWDIEIDQKIPRLSKKAWEGLHIDDGGWVRSPDNRLLLSLSKEYQTLHRNIEWWAGRHFYDDSGWIRGPDNELLLSLSKKHRKMLTHPQCSSVVYGGRLNIDWVNMLQGSGWTRCYKDKGDVNKMELDVQRFGPLYLHANHRGD